jgi:GTPase
VHLVDVSEASGREPVDDFHVIMQELASFSEDLVAKPMILVATKLDAAQDASRLESLRDLAVERRLPFFLISSVTGQGIEDLKYAMAERIFAQRLALEGNETGPRPSQVISGSSEPLP